MRKASLLAATALGVIVGASLFGATPARADLPVIDPALIAIITAIKSVMDEVNSAISDVKNELGLTGPIGSLLGDGTFGTVQQLLQEGFTQEANYSKATVGAQQQIADASNTAMARFGRDMRNAQLRDEQTTSPVQCAALDNNQTINVAQGQAWKVGTGIENVSDPRGEADPGTPSFYGSAQGVQALWQLHAGRYCSQTESDAGLCTTSPEPNADQRAVSLFGTGTYNGQQGVDAANDYVTNLIQPVVPAALRGDQLTSTAGKDGAARRREYNARMSLAHNVLDYVISTQAPSVPLTAQEQQQMQNEGMTPVQTGSWLQALTLDVDRRYSDVNWAAQLQAMPPASVQREIALELAVSNYLALQNYRVGLLNASANATHLAASTEHNFPPATPMPTPSIGAN